MHTITLFQVLDTNIKWPKGVKRFESYDYFKFYSTEVPWNCAHGVQLSFSLRIRTATLRCTNTGHLTRYPTFQTPPAAYRTFHKRSTRHCTNYRIHNSLIFKQTTAHLAGRHQRKSRCIKTKVAASRCKRWARGEEVHKLLLPRGRPTACFLSTLC